jgi:hypothetical protein
MPKTNAKKTPAQRVSRDELRRRALAFMEPGKAYRAREMEDGCGVGHGKQGDPLLRELHRMHDEGLVVGQLIGNGYTWRLPRGPGHDAQVTPGEKSAKSTDNKGRVTLGEKFANRTVLVKELSDTEVLIELATVIPDRELWLHKNSDAIASVARGLQEARAGNFVDHPPDIAGDAKLVKRLMDD